MKTYDKVPDLCRMVIQIRYLTSVEWLYSVFLCNLTATLCYKLLYAKSVMLKTYIYFEA